MNIGDKIENAIWLTGDEPQEMKERYKKDVEEAMTEFCEYYGFTHGPLSFIEMRPEEDQVPEVPEHIRGQKVRLLFATAEITGKRIQTVPDSFVANLDPKDLARLRGITRMAGMKSGHQLTDSDCDDLIEAIGPEAAIATLRGAIDVGAVH